MEDKCSCGGEFNPVKDMPLDAVVHSVCGNPRHSKKKRLAKKFKKERDEKAKSCLLGAGLMQAVMPPSFVCNKCGMRENFYQHVGRALFKVEELPQGAYARYK